MNDPSTCPPVARQARGYARLLLAALAALLLAAVPALADFIPLALDVPALALGREMRQSASSGGSRTCLSRISAPGFATTGPSGSPALPSRLIYIALPPDADESSVGVEGALSSQVLPGAYDIGPTPPIAAVGEPTQAHAARDAAVYGSDAFYPREHVRVAAIGHMRTWKIATVEYWPYCYNPVSGKLRVVDPSFVRIRFERAREAALTTGDLAAKGMAAFVANQSDAAHWYSAAGDTDSTDPGYAVVTTKAIAASSEKLRDFVDLQTLRGFSVRVATEDDWGGGIGNSAADNIRRWLAEHYLEIGIRYVLLIGNPDPAKGDVPMKMLWPRYRFGSYREAPSDYYYADLSGNWDADGDGIFGEEPDDFAVGGIDRLPEVYVGRIPFYGSMADLDRILAKTISYESAALGDWSTRAILAMRPLDPSTPSYQLGEDIRRHFTEPAGLATTRLYQSDFGLVPAPDRMPCTYDAMREEWSTGAGFVCWMAHGGTQTADGVINSELCGKLDDSRPSFVFQVSCSNGTPEAPDNLGYSLLRSGAIATVSASRVCWYYIGESDFTDSDSAGGIAYQYAGLVLGDRTSCGRAAFEARLRVPMCLWSNQLVLNLYGDPSAGLSGPAPGAIAGTVATISGEPIPGATVRTADGSASTLAGPDGAYLLRGLSEGAKEIIVSADGFYPQKFCDVPVSYASATRLNARLAEAANGAVIGHVYDVYGVPVPEAVIQAEATSFAAQSLVDGSYCISELPAGSYRLTASKYPFAQETVPDCAVAEGEETELDIVLRSRTGNAILNSGFEDGFEDGLARCWEAYATAGYSGASIEGCTYRKYGRYSQGLRVPPDENGASVGVSQTVKVLPGKRYSIIAWARDHIDGGDADPAGTVICRLGYDPTGGSDPASRTVVWLDFDPVHDLWHPMFAEVTPYTPSMTVFLDAKRRSYGAGQDCCAWFDGAALMGPITAPSVPSVAAGGRYQSEAEPVRGAWSSPDSDVVGYEWAVSSTPDESGILPGGAWTDAGLAASGIREGLPLANGGLVRVLTRAMNQSGIASGTGVSEAVRIVADIPRIADAKHLSDGTWVRLHDVRVSRMGAGPRCHVQEADRAAGIEAVGDWSRVPYVAPGTRAVLVGKLATVGPTRVITEAEVMPSIVLAPPRALGMRAACLGRVGADNSGLLVMVVGRVTGTSSDGFTLDDGSLPEGLPVLCPAAIALPKVGDYVRVVGISTHEGLVVCSACDVTEVD